MNSQCDAWQKNNIGKKVEVHNVPGIVKYCPDKDTFKHQSRFQILTYSQKIFLPLVFTVGNFEVEPENRHVISQSKKRCQETLTSAIASISKAFLESSLRMATPKRKSNRCRKPMKSVILTSSMTRSELQE